MNNEAVNPNTSKKVVKSMFNKEKWLPMVYLPFRISHYCCGVMKKGPLHIYQTTHSVSDPRYDG